MTLPNGERVGAILAAAGSSRRMGGRDKLWETLGGRPLILWSLAALDECPLVDEIVVAVAPADCEGVAERLSRERWRLPLRCCAGGKRRQDSVRHALGLLAGCAWVVVHDGARPLVTPQLLGAVLAGAEETGAAVAGLPLHDTLQRVGQDGAIARAVRREGVWAIQTPQAFRYDLLTRAFARVRGTATDEGTLVRRLGHPVQVVRGDRRNLKVTEPEDLALAEAWLALRGDGGVPRHHESARTHGPSPNPLPEGEGFAGG